VLLLLGVLERREEVRVRRLGVREGGMGALLAELGWGFRGLKYLCEGLTCYRKRSALAMREFEELVVSSKSLKEVFCVSFLVSDFG
jgi:hypothetical protein